MKWKKCYHTAKLNSPAAVPQTESLTNVPILGFFPILPSRFPNPPPGLFTLWASNAWWSNDAAIGLVTILQTTCNKTFIKKRTLPNHVCTICDDREDAAIGLVTILQTTCNKTFVKKRTSANDVCTICERYHAMMRTIEVETGHTWGHYLDDHHNFE